MNKYKIVKLLGDGTYSKVYEGINIQTKQKVAIKKLKNKMSPWEEYSLHNEIRFLRQMSNKNIIKLIEVFRDLNKDICYVFELCDCNLYEFIEKHSKHKTFIAEEKIRNIIYQITCALNYLHSFNIMHCDLKPENILMITNNNLVKLADFGTAIEIPKYKDNSLSNYICTRWYRAPECILKSQNYNEKIDIWALGCIMAELYTLNPIFPGINELDQLNKIFSIIGTPYLNEWPEGYALMQKLNILMPYYMKGNLKQIVFNASDVAINFLEYIFQINPEKRPSAAHLLRHPYFTGIQGPSLYNYQISNLNGSRLNKSYNYLNVFNNNNPYPTTSIRTFNSNNDLRNSLNSYNSDNSQTLFSLTHSFIRNNPNYLYNNILDNNKLKKILNLSSERNKKRAFPYNYNSARSSYNSTTYSSNQSDQQSKINTNNYHYYKNLNYLNYAYNSRNLAYAKNHNFYTNNNMLLNSYNNFHNNRFLTLSNNEVMQNMKRQQFYSGNRRTSSKSNSKNKRIYNNNSPFLKHRNQNNYYNPPTARTIYPKLYYNKKIF